jgi:hypothetical protein
MNEPIFHSSIATKCTSLIASESSTPHLQPMSSSPSVLLPSPELDGDFDPSIHLTPTKTALRQSVRFMKSAIQIDLPAPEDEVVDMRDSSSPYGGPERHSYVRDQSSPHFIAPINNPLDVPSYPAISTVYPVTALASVRKDEYEDIVDDYYYGHDVDDDDDYDDLQYSTPPPMPPARGMYAENYVERRHPFQVSQDSTVLSPSNAMRSLQSSSFTASSEGDSTTSSGSLCSTSSGKSCDKGCACKHVPTRRHRSRHIRSTFVLDGNFSFDSTNQTSVDNSSSSSNNYNKPECRDVS